MTSCLKKIHYLAKEKVTQYFVGLLITLIVFVFGQDLVFIMGKRDLSIKSFPVHLQVSQKRLRSRLCDGQSMCENNVS